MTKYKLIVVYDDHAKFSEIVNAYTEDGWQLHGPTTIHRRGEWNSNVREQSGEYTHYSQAVTKDDS